MEAEKEIIKKRDGLIIYLNIMSSYNIHSTSDLRMMIEARTEINILSWVLSE